jgi:hypothetical protein
MMSTSIGKSEVCTPAAEAIWLLNVLGIAQLMWRSYFFKSFCCSMYCAHLWSSFSNTVFRKLRTSFNKVFRMLMTLDRRASISKAMLDANVNAFEINVRQNIYSFMVRLNNSNNLVIEVLLNSFQYHSSAIFTQWYNKLYI